MAGISPQSEGGASSNAAECFQNYTAPEVFIQGLAGMVNQHDIETIIRSQKYMLQRFEKSNEMMKTCNALSATRYQNALLDFKRHTAMLTEMRKDIDNIFKRIRTVKAKISQQYPHAYEVAAAVQRREKSREDDEDEEERDGGGFGEELGSSSSSHQSHRKTKSSSSSSSSVFSKSKSVSIASPPSSTAPTPCPSRQGTVERSESVDIPKSSGSGGRY